METIRKLIPATREQVFRVLIDAGYLRQWWRSRGRQVIRADIQPQPGGVFRVDLADESGAMIYAGRILTLQIPLRLAFSWQSPACGRNVSIDITLESAGNDTFVAITHDLPADIAAHEAVHWPDVADSLALFCTKRKQD